MTLDARFAGLARHDQDRLLIDLAREKPVEGESPEVTAARLFAELADIPFDGAARAEPGSEWQTDVLDLPAYLRRVGWVGEAPPPSLESLKALHWAHLSAIGFHNLTSCSAVRSAMSCRTSSASSSPRANPPPASSTTCCSPRRWSGSASP